MPAVDAVETYPFTHPGKPTRLMATLSPRDDARWAGLAARVSAAMAPRLAPGVLMGREARTPEDLRSELRRARGASTVLAERGPVLATDVRDFYPSVEPGALRAGLERAGVDAGDARAAAEMLTGWEARGHRGLPIGPEASAVMAVALLSAVDEAIGDRPFLRWIDDYLIGVRTEADAEAISDRLDEVLASLGLERSGPKTRFLPQGSAGPWPGSLSAGDLEDERC